MPKPVEILLSTAFRDQLTEVGDTEGGEVVLAALSEQQRVCIHGPAAATYALSLARMALSKGLRIRLLCDDPPTGQFWKKRLSEGLLLLPPASIALQEDIRRQEAWQRHSQQPIFGHYSLADLLALQQQTVKENGRNLLTPYLSTLDFRFDLDELLDYRQKIGSTQRLYNKIGPLPALIQELSTGIFYHQTQADSEQFIREKLAEYTSDCHQLLRSFLGQINTFYWQQQANYQAIYQGLSSKLRQAERQQAMLEASFGKAAMQSVPSRLSARLGKKQKDLRSSINAFYGQLLELRDTHQAHQAFLLDWPADISLDTPANCFELLLRYRQQLNLWYEEIPNQLREASLGLSSRSASEPAISTALATLEKQLDELLERINDGGLFQRPLTTQAHTTTRQHKQLEQLLEKLLQLQALLDNYPAYYRWQHNWFTLPANLRRILAPLLLLPEDNWAAAFDHWYLQQALGKRPLGSPSPLPPTELPALFQQLATAKARQRSEATIYPLQPDQLLLNEEESHKAIDLILDLRSVIKKEDKAAAPLDSPCLHLQTLPDRSSAPNSYYLWQQLDYSPAMVFFCPWFSSRLPDWQAIPHPNDFYQLSLLLSQQLLGEDAPTNQQLALRSLLADLAATQQNAILFGVAPDGQLIAQATTKPLLETVTKACLIFPADQNSLQALQALPLQQLANILYCIPSLRFIHAFSTDVIQQALLTDGLNSAFLLATLLRGSEAIEEQDYQGFQAIAAEHRHRIGLASVARPALLDSLVPFIQQSFPTYRLLVHTPWRDTFLPILLESPAGQRHVVLLDGILPSSKGIFTELQRQEMLLAAGFKLHYLYCEDLLDNLQEAMEQLRSNLEIF